MIRVTKAAVRKWTALLLHTHDTPRRTAAAFAVGVFFGFSPMLGLHTILALLVAFILGLNRVAVVAGVYSNLPWILAPYYTLATLAGARMLGVPAPAHLRTRLAELFDLSFFGHAFWSGVWALLEPMLWPYVVGSTLGGLVLAGLAYFAAVPAIVAGRRHLHLPHRHPHEPEGP
jgi:uncharacterized protein (DUF2062 family)